MQWKPFFVHVANGEYPLELCHWTIETFQIFYRFCQVFPNKQPKVFVPLHYITIPVSHEHCIRQHLAVADYVTQKISSNTTSWNMISTGREGCWSRLLLVVIVWETLWYWTPLKSKLDCSSDLPMYANYIWFLKGVHQISYVLTKYQPNITATIS